MKVSTSPEPVFACKFVHLACEEVSAGGESLAGLHEHLISPLGWISVSEESLGHCGGDGTTFARHLLGNDDRLTRCYTQMFDDASSR